MGPRVGGGGGERRGESVGGSSGGAAGRLGAPDHSHSVGWGSCLLFFSWFQGCNLKDFFIVKKMKAKSLVYAYLSKDDSLIS